MVLYGYGVVWHGMVEYGVVWIWRGMVGYGMAWYGMGALYGYKGCEVSS